MRETTAVSIRGDRRFVRALNLLAEEKEKSTGELLREIVDEAYGEELEEKLASVPERVYKRRRSSKKSDNASQPETMVNVAS